MKTVTITGVARRFPDPVFKDKNLERVVLVSPVSSVPAGIPKEPNARGQNIRKKIYQEVEQSLLGEDCIEGTFHLKNKGITLIARRVERVGDDEWEITFDDGHGIVDGGHTYEIIQKNRDYAGLPENQFVKLDVLTCVPDAWISDISRGLNTSVQVQESSLLNLEKAFDWIKEELQDEPYFSKIGWSENDGGLYDVRDIIAMIYSFHIGLFPNSKTNHPIAAYEKKRTVLDAFKKDFDENNGDGFRRLRPILKEVLILWDTIRIEFPEIHTKMGGKGRALTIVDSKPQKTNKKGPQPKPYEFIFINKSSYGRLQTGAAYPIFAALRWMVEEDPVSGKYQWRGGFEAVLGRWEQVKKDLVAKTAEKGREVGNSSDAIGKSRTHWGNLHQNVAFVDLMETRSA